MNRRKSSLTFIVCLAGIVLIAINLGYIFDYIEGSFLLFLSVFAAGIATGIGVAILFGSIRSASAATEIARILSRLPNDALQSTLAEIENEVDARGTAYLNLMSNISLIERKATDLLPKTGPSTRRRGFLALRSGLFDLGFWTNEDARQFDEALRVRNALVHGDIEAVSKNKIMSAVKTTNELLDKLRAINTDAT